MLSQVVVMSYIIVCRCHRVNKDAGRCYAVLSINQRSSCSSCSLIIIHRVRPRMSYDHGLHGSVSIARYRPSSSIRRYGLINH